ncbi:hypothetical protein [Halocatena salina]|uniref:Helix-turn-helix domain-containing protein n=1 Tax=Halocatena salina TaxID=2934340 RepID=A0A8U0A0F5_9EURY|nr:hypothetical protein [Halocatena salina]UPM42554.1 hypothetical protein MW046_11395 [Halocatena salina]
MTAPGSIEPTDLSPLAWRLLRIAAGYEQRAVERELDDILQAHISMLESGSRALSNRRRQTLLELYAAELSPEQVTAIVEHF